MSTPIKLKSGKEARLMYCYMIPLKEEQIPSPIDIANVKDAKYKNLLLEEYLFINSKGESERIVEKAAKLYKQVYNKPTHYLHNYCCSFELLEEFCDKYTKQ